MEQLDNNWIYFEEFLSKSFCAGQASRELRLSPSEVDYIKTHYPSMSLLPLDKQISPKAWYLVSVHIPLNSEQNHTAHIFP